tara:strand:+ start:329 stop:1405 length:1077 start_codon:yes stop_codon:yes gene_type:complete
MSFYPDDYVTNIRLMEKNKAVDVTPQSNDPAWFVDQRITRRNKNWFEYVISKRLKEQRNTMIFILGAPRTGKSWSSITLANAIDQNNDFDHSHIVWTIPELVQLIKNTKEKCCIVFDESGANFSNRNFMSSWNKALNFILQTFGSRYINIIFNLPLLSFADKSARDMATFSLLMMKRGEARAYSHWSDLHFGKNFRRFLGTIKINSPLDALKQKKHHYLWSPEHDQTSKGSPCFGLDEHLKKDCYRFWNPLIYEYENRKRQYQDDLFEQTLKQTQALAEKESGSQILNHKEIIANIVQEPDKYCIGGKLNAQVVSVKMGVGISKAGAACNILREKYAIGKNDNFLDISRSVAVNLDDL